VLEESGVSVAPPPRSRLAKTAALPALPTQRSTRQRRSDPPTDANTSRLDEETASSDSDTSRSVTSKSEGNASSTSDDEHQDGPTASMFMIYNVLTLSILTFL
jgi:hypothetical protein